MSYDCRDTPPCASVNNEHPLTHWQYSQLARHHLGGCADRFEDTFKLATWLRLEAVQQHMATERSHCFGLLWSCLFSLKDLIVLLLWGRWTPMSTSD